MFLSAFVLVIGSGTSASAANLSQSEFILMFEQLDVSGVLADTQTKDRAVTLMEEYSKAVDKSAFLQALNLDDLKIFKVSNQVISYDSTFVKSGASAASLISSYAVVSPSCYSGTLYRSGQDVFGITLWEFGVKGTWCGLFSSVSSPKVVTVFPTYTAPGWVASGLLDKGATLYSNTARIYGQYRFDLNLVGWNVQSVYPCGRIIGYVSGSYSGWTACGPY
jgi:hypothetical protein